MCRGREDHGCNAGVSECSIVGGRGVLLLLTPVEWVEPEGRERRKWRMSGAEKRKKGWDILNNKEEQGKGGGKKYLLQEWVRPGDKKPHEQNDVSTVPQYLLQTFPKCLLYIAVENLKILKYLSILSFLATFLKVLTYWHSLEGCDRCCSHATIIK